MSGFLFSHPLSFHIRTCFIYQAELVLNYMVLYWPSLSAWCSNSTCSYIWVFTGSFHFTLSTRSWESGRKQCFMHLNGQGWENVFRSQRFINLPHGIFQKFLENVLQWRRNVREDCFCVAINNKAWSYTICVFTDLPEKEKLTPLKMHTTIITIVFCHLTIGY